MLNLEDDGALKDMSAVVCELKRDLAYGVKAASSELVLECREVMRHHKDSIHPNRHEIYQAALLYMQGAIGADMDYLYDIAAFGLYLPIESMEGRAIAEDPRRLAVLLNRYKDEARHGRLWDMTWLAVLHAYYTPETRGIAQEAMRSFLSDTWPVIEGSARHPRPWLSAIAAHPGFLLPHPADSFSADWLSGQGAGIVAAADDIGISPRSWFWHDLAQAALTRALAKPDAEFLRLVPSLIALAVDMHVGGLEAMAEILRRYARLQEKPLHAGLMAAALSFFGDPRLRNSATSAWKAVSEESWLLVLGWVQEERARRLFELLSAQQTGLGSDRLAVWLRYVAWNRSLHDAGCRERLKNEEVMRLMALEDEILSKEASRYQLDDFLARVSAYMTGA